MRYMTVGFKREVSLVVLPIDDFTERVITGSTLRMYTEEGKRPSIRKPDGYHVFCDLTGSTVRICVESPLYQKQIVEFPLGDMAKVYLIRMLPNESYPIPAGATCVRGKLKPDSRIRLFFPEQKKNYKLLYDYTPGGQDDSLALFCPETVQLEGKTLCIKGAGEEGEFFRVKGQTEENCLLEHPLKQGYKKIGTSVYPVYEAYADAEGCFYLPIRSIPTESGSCTCLIAGADGKEEICRTLMLKAGKENRITEDIYMEASSEQKSARKRKEKRV